MKWLIIGIVFVFSLGYEKGYFYAGGVGYECGKYRGVTAKDGMFYFQKGKSCRFKIGSFVFKTIKADRLENNKIFFEDSSKTASFLQTLDIDGDFKNGIEITKKEIEFLKFFPLSLKEKNIKEMAYWLESLMEYRGKYVSKTEALLNTVDYQNTFLKKLFSDRKFYYVEERVKEISFNKELTLSKMENRLVLVLLNSEKLTLGKKIADVEVYKDKIKLVFNDEVKMLFFSKKEAENFDMAKYLKSLLKNRTFYEDGRKVTFFDTYGYMDFGDFKEKFEYKIKNNRLFLNLLGENIQKVWVFRGDCDEGLFFKEEGKNFILHY